MNDPYTPNDAMQGATRDMSWLAHWRKLAQQRLESKPTEGTNDQETIDLRIRVALIDRIIELQNATQEAAS